MSDWYCKLGKQVLGPFDFEELRFLKIRGQLTADHLVRRGETEPWLRAGRIKVLFPNTEKAAANTKSQRPVTKSAGAPPSPIEPPPIQNAAWPAGEAGSQRNPALVVAMASGLVVVVLIVLLLLLWKSPAEEPSGKHLAGTGDTGGVKSRGDGGSAADKSEAGHRARPQTRPAKATRQPRLASQSPARSANDPSAATSRKSLSTKVVAGGNSRSIAGSSFFGHRAKGSRFVYVVDCSGSMRGERFAKAQNELLRSIHNLEANQSFYVIFFSTRSYPMFSPDREEPGLLSASRSNVNRVTKWVKAFTIKGGTEPETALTSALTLKPDAVFFLTDGQIFDARFAEKIDGKNGNRTPIYTICFQNRAGELLLKKIASDSRGEYRFVP